MGLRGQARTHDTDRFEEPRGRVAILLNPYSSITEMEPWQEEHWTPHWMAARIALMGETVLVVNVYAPSDKSEREAFFEMLRDHLLGYNGPMFMGGDFNCTLVPRLDRSFASSPGRHDSLALCRLLGRAQLSDVLDDELARYHNDITIRIGAPRLVVRVRKPRRVYPVPGCAQAVANRAIFAALETAQIAVNDTHSVPPSDHATARSLADWWDGWKINLRKVLLANTKKARQGLTRSFRQWLSRLYVRLDAALLEACSADDSPARAPERCDQTIPVDTRGELRQYVAQCRRLWQRTKKERLLTQHTYSSGETSRRYFARVSTKSQDNTIISLGGKAAYGSNRSQELDDEMADGWEHIMVRSFDYPGATAEFLTRPPDRTGLTTPPPRRPYHQTM